MIVSGVESRSNEFHRHARHTMYYAIMRRRVRMITRTRHYPMRL